MRSREGPSPMLIDGRLRHSEQPRLVLVNPADGCPIREVSTAGRAEVSEAVESAARAASSAPWQRLRAHERAAIVRRIGDLVDERAAVLADLQMKENGKPFGQCLAQARSAAATFRYYAAVCETITDELPPSRGPYLAMTVHEPYGVVAAITPWNSPLTLEAQKVAPALAAGNAVVLKPSELTPSTALALGALALESGLPAGLLNVIPGTGAVAGALLVADERVRMITFTGGTSTGGQVAAVASSRFVPVSLELGGKSPHIVFDDADLDAAVPAVADGIFDGGGQSCVAGSRLFVQRRIFDDVVAKVAARARAVRVELPDANGVDMGPLVSHAHRDRIERVVDEARARGAHVVAGGFRPDAPHLRRGAFYAPTVLTEVANSDPIAQQEVFGPVLCAIPFEDEEDLVRQANDSVYGLAAGVWSADYRRALRIARALDAGTVWINTYKQLSIATPFGGYKHSGIGREKGIAGLRLYQQTKGIYLGMPPAA